MKNGGHDEVSVQRLKDRLLSMGGRCERMLATAMRALVEGERALVEQVFADEDRTNGDELAIDELALRLLALRQPLGKELRFTLMAMKIVADLERIADEAVNVAERADELLDLGVEPGSAAKIGTVEEMARHARTMLRDSLEAFVHEDAERARAVFPLDDRVDAGYGAVQRHSRSRMREDGDAVEVATRVAAVARYLERIGDHATSIAEMVVFMVEGRDVRHGDGS